jgi:hypothetical protein
MQVFISVFFGSTLKTVRGRPEFHRAQSFFKGSLHLGSIFGKASRYVPGEQKMTFTKPLTISECAAKTLLAAWNSRDLLRLRSALVQTDAISIAHLPAFEQERFELLHEIAKMMRWTGQPQSSEDLEAGLGLLRHLAHPAHPAEPVWITEAPQPEMRVSVRH